MARTTQLAEFETLRPRLLALLEMHRAAETDEQRATLVDLFADVFLSTAWHVAQDLLENGWQPGFATTASSTAPRGALRLVDDNAA